MDSCKFVIWALGIYVRSIGTGYTGLPRMGVSGIGSIYSVDVYVHNHNNPYLLIKYFNNKLNNRNKEC